MVTLPAIAHKQAQTLSPAQLKTLLLAMRYPEREIALFTVLTEMSLAEICGLQWKYTNRSDLSRLIDGEITPPKTIAVRKQSYRGEFGDVPPGRNRFVRMPDVLASILANLKNRQEFTSPDDFVLVSRNGTPIHPENIAARRLKSIGKSLDMPWLSWAVFRRTRMALKSQFGRKFQEELRMLLLHPNPEIHPHHNNRSVTPIPAEMLQHAGRNARDSIKRHPLAAAD